MMILNSKKKLLSLNQARQKKSLKLKQEQKEKVVKDLEILMKKEKNISMLVSKPKN